MGTFYRFSSQQVLLQLKPTPTGLLNEAVISLQQQYGENALQEAKQRSKLFILLAQFRNIMILILRIAAIISFVVGEHTDAFVILAIIIANALIGYSQEYNAEKSIKMLQKMSAQYVLVIRIVILVRLIQKN